MPAEKLDNISLIEITGEDATSFLQGQLTNDINLAKNCWQYSGYCNPKGRLLALFQLWQSNESTYLITDTSLAEFIIKRLRMYVMRSKVKLTAIECDFYGLTGKKTLSKLSPSLSEDTVSKLTTNENFISSDQGVHILSFADRFLIINETTAAKPITSTEKAPTQNNNEQQWSTINIESGLPHIDLNNTELFIPQMLNLDILGGINFKKGCYTGQEIIARMHYLGKLKQRMLVCQTESSNSEEIIKAGDKIFNDLELTKSIGRIVNANQGKALAVINIDTINEREPKPATQLYIDTKTTLSINKDQPYSLENDK